MLLRPCKALQKCERMIYTKRVLPSMKFWSRNHSNKHKLVDLYYLPISSNLNNCNSIIINFISWKCFFKKFYSNDLNIVDSDVMVALDSRHFDQLAKSFLQKEKRKLWKIHAGCDVYEWFFFSRNPEKNEIDIWVTYSHMGACTKTNFSSILPVSWITQ